MKTFAFVVGLLCCGTVLGHEHRAPIVFKLYDEWGRPEVFVTKLRCIPYFSADDATWYCIHRVQRRAHGFSPVEP